MKAANIRKQKDILTLKASKYSVHLEENKSDELVVIFLGPESSYYEGVRAKLKLGRMESEYLPS